MDPKAVFDFTGKTAIVTGATGGMGRGIAKDLARCGAEVVIHTSSKSNAEAAEELSYELHEYYGSQNGSRTLVVTANLVNLDEGRQLVDTTLDHFGKIDFLVNNSGILHLYEIKDMSPEAWDETLDINLKGAVFLTQRAMANMMERRSGKIVNIGSSLSANGGVGPEGVDYNISKAGIQCFTKTLARQLAPYGINVNAVGPGIIDTPMLSPFGPEERESMVDAIPLGRLGTPEDIGDAVAFLCSDAASWITGQTFHVNGGMRMVD